MRDIVLHLWLQILTLFDSSFSLSFLSIPCFILTEIRCVVRLCAALLSQFVNSLAPSLSIILVCGKQVTIGVALGTETVVNKPLSPNELYTIMRDTVYSKDPVQFSLQQELILWVSSLLTSDKELFNGIKFIRLGWASGPCTSDGLYLI